MKNEKPLEILAELEHEQWIHWSKSICKNPEVGITQKKREAWEKLWRPYCELTEEEKEQDRKWARKVLAFLPRINAGVSSKAT
jgi:hypothetical protein